MVCPLLDQCRLAALHTSVRTSVRHACSISDSGTSVVNLCFAVPRASTRSRSASTIWHDYLNPRRLVKERRCLGSSWVLHVASCYLLSSCMPVPTPVIHVWPESLSISLAYSARIAIATTFLSTICIWSSISVSVILEKACPVAFWGICDCESWYTDLDCCFSQSTHLSTLYSLLYHGETS